MFLRLWSKVKQISIEDNQMEITVAEDIVHNNANVYETSFPHSINDSLCIFICNQIVNRCEKWAKDNWDTPASPIIKVKHNPGLRSGAPCYARFKAAIEKTGIDITREDSYAFGWHGTSECNVQPICYDGFDTKLRKGQQHGTKNSCTVIR
jgi:hypothetical protein